MAGYDGRIRAHRTIGGFRHVHQPGVRGRGFGAFQSLVDEVPTSEPLSFERLLSWRFPRVGSRPAAAAWASAAGARLAHRKAPTLAVAGTHGKTTTSALLAHLMNGQP